MAVPPSTPVVTTDTSRHIFAWSWSYPTSVRMAALACHGHRYTEVPLGPIGSERRKFPPSTYAGWKPEGKWIPSRRSGPSTCQCDGLLADILDPPMCPGHLLGRKGPRHLTADVERNLQAAPRHAPLRPPSAPLLTLQRTTRTEVQTSSSPAGSIGPSLASWARSTETRTTTSPDFPVDTQEHRPAPVGPEAVPLR